MLLFMDILIFLSTSLLIFYAVLETLNYSVAIGTTPWISSLIIDIRGIISILFCMILMLIILEGIVVLIRMKQSKP